MRRRGSARRRSARQRLQILARARIQILWEEAREEASKRPELARRHVRSAKRIAQKARIKLPQEMVRHICRNCDSVLLPGSNARVRLRTNRSRHLSVTCLRCGHTARYYVNRS
ncbi:ribonuclease P [Candidatus Thorarchaeota archaeon]|nr:MAG: ribonuclease P [Candidatus Thorarchaeota archaeon]